MQSHRRNETVKVEECVTPPHGKSLFHLFFPLSPLSSRSGRWLLQTFVAWHLHRDSVRPRICHLDHYCYSGTSRGHPGVFPPSVPTGKHMDFTFSKAQSHAWCIWFCFRSCSLSLSVLPNSCTFTWKQHQNQTQKRSTTAAGGTSRLPRPTRSSAPDEAQTKTQNHACTS